MLSRIWKFLCIIDGTEEGGKSDETEMKYGDCKSVGQVGAHCSSVAFLLSLYLLIL